MSIYLVGYTQLKIDIDRYTEWSDFAPSDDHGYFVRREDAEAKAQELNKPEMDGKEQYFNLLKKEHAKAIAHNKKVDDALKSGISRSLLSRRIVPAMPSGENSLAGFLSSHSRDGAKVWEVLELSEEEV